MFLPISGYSEVLAADPNWRQVMIDKIPALYVKDVFEISATAGQT